MNTRAPWRLLVATCALLAASCASVPKLSPAEGAARDERCQDVEYRGVYRDAEHPEGRRFRLKARVCSSGRVFAEIRGAVGGPGLVAAARPGGARLLFPRDRVAIDGPDEPAFWLAWTGAPLSGALLVGLMDGRLAGSDAPEGWRIELSEGTSFPARVEARGPERRALELERRDVSAAPAPPGWPEVPESFEHRVEAGG